MLNCFWTVGKIQKIQEKKGIMEKESGRKDEQMMFYEDNRIGRLALALAIGLFLLSAISALFLKVDNRETAERNRGGKIWQTNDIVKQ
jgi:hypothetical protein